MNKLFITVLVIIVILCTALAIYLYVALVPYFKLVGWIALSLLIVMALCAIAFILVFTFSKTSIMLSERLVAINNRQLLTHGEVVVWLRPDGTYVHLSALHEAAKVPQIPQTIEADTPDEIQAYSDADIRELYEHGSSERTIAEAYKITRSQVRKALGK